MTLVSRDLGIELGFDTDTKLSGAMCQRLAASVYAGKPLTFAIRYVHHGPAPREDLDPDELRSLLGAGFTVLVVQHPRAPADNILSADVGKGDAEWAIRNATAAGYVTPAGSSPICLALDLEGVRNPGAAVAAFAVVWCQAVAAAGYRPVIYVGYGAGLSPQDLYELPNVDRYWAAWGPWTVAKRGVCCKQHETVTVAGVELDPDYAYPDNEGGVLTGLADVETEPVT